MDGSKVECAMDGKAFDALYFMAKGSVLSVSPFDLHVLSTPPAFVLSQDQTLHKRALSALALRDILAICQQANRFITLLKNRLGSYYPWKLRA